MVRFSFACVATLFAATVAVAAPSRPLIVIFTAQTGDSQIEGAALRARQTALALRDTFNETGLVDAVLYAPENALFVRATMEAKIKPADPLNLSESERYALAKAAGASYCAYLVSGLPSNTTPGAVDVQLQTEQIDGRKTWSGRGGYGATGKSSGKYDNAVLSAANQLVQDFLRGPLRELAQVAAPSLPPPAPIPVTKADVATVTAPSVAAPVPMTAPVVAPVTVPMTAPTVPVAPVVPKEALPSSGANTGNAAEAQQHQGDEQRRAGDASGAILSYRKAVSLDPLNARYRASLAGAYLMAGRREDALSEAKRAVMIVPPSDLAGKIAAGKMLAEVLTENGDTAAARSTYEELLRTDPTQTWAMTGLAEVLIGEGKTDEAVALYQKARQADGGSKEIARGYIRLLATTGDYDGALRELKKSGGANDTVRYDTTRNLFDEGVVKIAERVEQNRTAWLGKRISQDVFYKATASQTAKVSGLLALLKAVPPAETADAGTRRDHNKRVFAASLLLQGVASLLTQVETGDADAGKEATVFLTEFRREMPTIAPGKASTVP
ncbi:MAG: tetratricopeptide repeat protein [Armatimonadetes bacterium]|nr:tetratricopeptide repeat protein [Armatimonadota bacterium]